MQAELIDHMGSDLTVVNAARCSFSKHKDELDNSDTKLISYLAGHGHFTPFTHPQITLRYTVPIFVARQEFKHIVGFTRNEISRRYVDTPPEFFTPEVWRSRPEGSVKQGSGSEAVTHVGSLPINDAYEHLICVCEDTYKRMLEAGVAPEQARMVLPQSMMTSYYVTGSLAAFARAYKQRVDPHAQKEIRDLFAAVGAIIAPLFPVSWAALTA